MRSGYLRRAFSASSLVLNGLDKITSSRPLYSNNSHRADDFIRDFSGVAVVGGYTEKCPSQAKPISADMPLQSDSYPRENGLFPVRPRVALLLVLLPVQSLDAKAL